MAEHECHYQGFWYSTFSPSSPLSLRSIECELLFLGDWESLCENLQVKAAILDRLRHVFSTKCTLASI